VGVVRGDITALQAWLDALRSVDAVVHAAATFEADMGAVDRALLDALLPGLAAASPGAALLYTGGCWLYGATGDRIADETSPLDPLAEFAWMVEGLNRVLSAPKLRGMVLHPAMVYEAGGGVLSRFVADARERGRVRVVGDEGIRWPLVHRDDLAALYVLMLERGRAGDLYNGTALAGVPVGRIARAIARRWGVEEAPLLQSVEAFAAERGSWARGYALDQQMSGDKARRVLGWRPVHADLLAEIAGWPTTRSGRQNG
jgi:nucleoside-diphosphate-sugar epimerase